MTTAAMPGKRIAPGAYEALVEALALVFWNKDPLERFLRLELRDHPELLAGLTFTGPKRQTADELIMRLAEDESRYQAVTLDLMERVASMDDFPNLRQQADRDGLIAAANFAVGELRKWTSLYSELTEARARLQTEQAEEERRAARTRSFNRGLENMKATFVSMHAETDHQERGREFQDLLNGLFSLFDLNPRRNFVLAAEEIDGAFTFNTDDYLLEAKWEKTSASRSDVDVLDAKVRRKGKNTLGLFVAVAGFSKPAIEAHSNTGGSLIFMDGADLMAVLEGGIALTDLLEAKRRHLSETGLPLFFARDLLG